MRAMVFFVVLCALPLAAAAADGGEQPASSGDETAALFAAVQKAYDEINYDKCVSLLAEIEQMPGLGMREKIAVLKFRALIHVNTENDIFAPDAIAAIYRLDPSFQLPDNEPPKILKAFADAKRDFLVRRQKKDIPVPEGKQIVTGGAVDGAPGRKPADGTDRPNIFVRYWPAWTGLAAGVALFTPGALLGGAATSDSATFQDAPRDSMGRIVGITKDQAKRMQDDADAKALAGNILMGAGAAAAIAGVVMLFVYDEGFHGWRVPVFAFSDGTALLVNVGGRY